MFYISVDQAPQWGKEAKNGVKEKKYRRAMAWGGGKGDATFFTSPDYLSARFARRFFFTHANFFSPISPNAEPGPRLVLYLLKKPFFSSKLKKLYSI